MNIIFATDQYWPTISGVPVSIDTFRKELQKMGNNVYVLAPDHPGAADLDRKMRNKNIFRFRSYALYFNKDNRLIYRSEKKNIFKVLDSLKPDIIHIQTEFPMAHIAISYAKKNNIPLVMTVHTNWEDLIDLYIPLIPSFIARLYCRARLRRQYNKADTVIVPTSLMELLMNLYFVNRPIRIIPTGINKKSFQNNRVKNGKSESSVYKDFPELKNQKILFFAGRIGKEKNIPFIFDVLKKLLVTDPGLQLVISGDGPAKEELIELAKIKKLDKNVIFTGFIERNKLKEFYAIADVFVFASKVESQGLVVLESMACGTPVVAIGKMGTREIMGGDSGGYMVDDDPDQFCDRVSVLLHNRIKYNIKSKEALKHAEKWSSNIMAKKMISLYRSLIYKYQSNKVNENISELIPEDLILPEFNLQIKNINQ